MSVRARHSPLLILTVSVFAVFLGAPTALAENQVGVEKAVTWTLKCTTTAKSGADSVGTSGTFSLEITDVLTFQAHIIIEPQKILKTGETSGPQEFSIANAWDITTANWKVAQIDETHSLSYAQKFRKLCNDLCALHAWQRLDVGGLIFLKIRHFGKPNPIDMDPDALSRLYPGLEPDKLERAEFLSGMGHQRFQYEDPADPTHIESGACERQG